MIVGNRTAALPNKDEIVIKKVEFSIAFQLFPTQLVHVSQGPTATPF